MSPAQTSKEFVKGKYSLNKDGVLVFDYGKAYNNLGKWANPYFISVYSNALYADYLASGCTDEDLKKSIITQADYLLKSSENRDGMAVWPLPFPNSEYGLSAGWLSGIGQARIASTLQRAYAITGRKEFFETAHAGMGVYRRSLKEGGVVTNEGPVTWIEEAADPKGQSFKVLNGHITALAGILDFYQITGEQEWKNVFDRGVAAVVRDLPKFDLGYTTLYSLDFVHKPVIAPLNTYHRLHTSQMLWLYDVTDNGVFLDYASRFLSYIARDDHRTASSSTAPSTNGPEKANGHLTDPKAYWSAQAFPAWFRVDLDKPAQVSGFATVSPSAKGAPREFALSAMVGGKWEVVAAGENKQRNMLLSFKPVQASALKLDIFSDNGNHNVALQIGAPIRAKPTRIPIVNYCNFRIGEDGRIMHLSPLTGGGKFVIRCDGWMILPKGHARSITVVAGKPVEIEGSSGFSDWHPLGKSGGGKLSLPTADQFIRIELPRTARSLDRVTLK